MSTAPKVQVASIFRCITGLRYYGIGARVARCIYKFPDTYFIVTRVKMTTDQKHGKVWGVMVWRGIRKNVEERLPAPLKKEWTLVGVPDYRKLGGNAEDFQIRLDELVKTYGQERVEWTDEEKAMKLAPKK